MLTHNSDYISTKIIKFFSLPKSLNSNIHIFKYIFFLFLGWRIALFFITYLGLSAFPHINFYTKELFFPNPDLDYWIRWANWDGKAYQDIANSGYLPTLTVFFPAFSIAIKILTFSGLNSFWAGFLLSNIFTIGALFFLFKLIRLDFDEKIAKRAVFALLIFPTSFYLGALYNESLALLTITGAFYFARQKRWILASVFASIAAVTRIIGIAAVAGIIFEYLLNYDLIQKQKISFSFLWKTKIRKLFLYVISIISFFNLMLYLNFPNNLLFKGIISSVLDLSNWILYPLTVVLIFDYSKTFLKFIKFKKIFSKNFLYILASIIPLSLYLLFQKIYFQSFFSFLAHESVWGKYLSTPWSGPLNSFQFLISNMFTIGEYSARVHVRFAIFTLALVCLIFSFKKLRLSYSIFFLLAFLIPLFSGTLIDFPRYSLVFFPLFIILGTIENELLQKTYILISISLLAFLSILFFNGYFFM